MDRRCFQTLLALSALTAPCFARPHDSGGGARWRELERRSGGRLGVAVLDTATGRLDGHRLDERFPMCSTFKWLAAALVLQRVDAGIERLDRRIRFDPARLPAHSPATSEARGSLTIAALCNAAVTLSDNGAANLLLDSFGGPAALTRFARSLGDDATRLDRMEPMLNEATPGDPRDTTTPRGMAIALRAAVLGEALKPASREQLIEWLIATQTGTKRLRAGIPANWRAGDKTGTGDRGSTNDVAVFWPPGRAPLIVAAYLTETKADEAARNGTLAKVGRAVAAAAS